MPWHSPGASQDTLRSGTDYKRLLRLRVQVLVVLAETKLIVVRVCHVGNAHRMSLDGQHWPREFVLPESKSGDGNRVLDSCRWGCRNQSQSQRCALPGTRYEALYLLQYSHFQFLVGVWYPPGHLLLAAVGSRYSTTTCTLICRPRWRRLAFSPPTSQSKFSVSSLASYLE